MTNRLWSCRAEFLYDEEGKTRQQVANEREAKQTALLREFMRGPPQEGDYDKVVWEESTRREEKFTDERHRSIGYVVVYEAPLED